MQTLALLIAVFAVVIGTVSLFANPTRFANQVFALISLMICSESLFIYAALVTKGELFWGTVSGQLPWVRANAAIIGFFPWSLWLMKEAIVTEEHGKKATMRSSLPWFVLGVGLACVCYTESFIPSDSQQDSPRRGIAYIWRALLLISALALLIVTTFKRLTKLSGIRYVETKFLVVVGIATAGISVTLVAIGTVISSQEMKTLALGVTLFGYAIMAWAMTVHRIFDARQILASCLQRILVILVMFLSVVGLADALDDLMGRGLSLVVSLGACSVIFWQVDKFARSWLGVDGHRNLSTLRGDVLKLASVGYEERELISAFERLFASQCKAEATLMAGEEGGIYASVRRKFGIEEEAFAALLDEGWATPESLGRRRSSHELGDLKRDMDRCALGLMLAIPAGSRSPSLFIALGNKVDEWPYTYPEVERILNIAELVDNVVVHSRVLAQAATSARLESWAFVCRGLAHDLKNLFAPVSSFLVNIEYRIGSGSPETEAHFSAVRAMQAVEQYTRGILLWDEIGELNSGWHSMRKILENVVQTMAFAAKQKGVVVALECDDSFRICGDAVLFERMIANLVVNAIDASSCGKEVKVSGCIGTSGRIRFEVSDKGRGISRSEAAMIFEPYVTSKNGGIEPQGFGLGLPIAKKIANLHGGDIYLVSEVGVGATFVVDLPNRNK